MHIVVVAGILGCMKPNQYGRIVMIASIHGVCGRKGVDTAPYAAAKGGIVNLTRSLGNSWARDGITVNCICPGYFPTEMTAAYIDAPFFNQAHLECCPMERHGKTGEMDGLCTYFASPACSYTTGQIICVDGGWSAISSGFVQRSVCRMWRAGRFLSQAGGCVCLVVRHFHLTHTKCVSPFYSLSLHGIHPFFSYARQQFLLPRIHIFRSLQNCPESLWLSGQFSYMRMAAQAPAQAEQSARMRGCLCCRQSDGSLPAFVV